MPASLMSLHSQDGSKNKSLISGSIPFPDANGKSYNYKGNDNSTHNLYNHENTVDPEKLLKNTNHASSIDDLHAVLQQVKTFRASVDNNLQRFVSSASLSHSQEARKLALLKSQLGSALSSSHDLLSTLSSASFVASSLAVKVRRLDLEQARVKEALKYVKDVIELKRSIQGVHHAMDIRDWERAASYIDKARQLPPSLVSGDFAKAMVPTAEYPDFPAQTLDEASAALGTVFLREFEKAAAEKNMENLTRYFKLFPLIGRESEGLAVYANFICGIITAHSRQRIQAATSSNASDSPMFYALATTRLFENIATIVNQHAPIVERHYGKGRMASVLDKTQDKADSQGGLIIDTLWDERNIPRVISDIKSYSFPYLVNSFSSANMSNSIKRANSPAAGARNSSEFGTSGYEPETVDLKSVGDYIRELSVILNRWSLYRKFLGFKWSEYSGEANITISSPESGSIQVMHMPEFLKVSNFEKKISSKVSPAFQTLAVFAFRRSLEKALQLEEFPDISLTYTPEMPLVTSLVEDSMYILKIILQQTLDSGEASIIQPVIASIRRILESDFVGAMQRKLRDEAPKAVSATATFNNANSSSTASGFVSRLSTATPPPNSSSSISGSGSPRAGGASGGPQKVGGAGVIGLSGLHGNEELRLRSFLVHLNNLSVAGDYTARIVGECSVHESLPFEDDAKDTLEQLKTFVDSFKHRCNELIDDGVQLAYGQIMSARIRHLVNNLFKDNDYFSSPGGDDDFSSSSTSAVNALFTREWTVIKNGLDRVMAPALYQQMLGYAAGLLSKTLEKRIWSLEGKVNELGAIKLDRDVSKVIGTISAGHYSLRDKFVRVAQIVMIVGLDDIDEEEGVQWVLNDSDRQRARLIRVERRELNS